MDVNSSDDHEEEILRSVLDPERLKTVVIEDAVVYPLSAGAILVYLFPLFTSIWDRAEEFEICLVISLDDSSIWRRTAIAFTGTFSDFTHLQRTAVFGSHLDLVIAVTDHFVSCHAYGHTILVDSFVSRIWIF